MRIKVIFLFIISVMAFIPSCTNGHSRAESDVFDRVSAHMKEIWADYYKSAEYDSLVERTYPYLDQAKASCDTSALLVSCAYMAQAFFFMDMRDSVRKYLDMAASYNTVNFSGTRLNCMLTNIEGLYAVKFELNYPKALVCFREVLRLAGGTNNASMELLALSNIVSIYYSMSDKYGLEYARSALNRLEGIQADETFLYMYEAPVYLSVARMEYLNGSLDTAWGYLSKADSMAKRYSILSITPPIYLLYGDICHAKGQDSLAGIYYEMAMDNAEDDAGVISMVCLNYGGYCEDMEDYAMARKLYERALTVSDSSGNMLYRSELLSRLWKLYLRTGQTERSYEYALQYGKCQDEVAFRAMEQEFSALQQSYKNIEFRYAMQAKEMDVLKARRNAAVSWLVAAIVLSVSVLLYQMYRKQRKMYAVLYSRHKEFVKRFDSDAATGNDEKPEYLKELYLRAETLMRESKVFKIKDMSLDKLSDMLDTNRTYLSKAINRYYGASFSTYLNTYRINEATKIISDPQTDLLIKQLADDLGYSSVPVFSKAFLKETGMPPSRYRKEAISENKC